MPRPLSFGPLWYNGRLRCSHNLAPTSDGPGIADLPWVAVAPISLAYSGLMMATLAVPRVARCQMPMKARNSATDTIAARKRREVVVISLAPHFAGSRRAKLALRGSG